MPIGNFFRKEEKTAPQELVKINKASNLQERQVDVDNTITDKVYLMELSTDKKWACYVSEYYDDISKTFTATLSIRRFKAINVETSEVEYPTPLSDGNSYNAYESRIQVDSDSHIFDRSLCINPYIDFSDDNTKCLSISPDGQYITISTYNEDVADEKGSCTIFKARKNTISFHHKLRCNGRAVLFNGKRDNLSLAIINTATMRIYKNIHTAPRNWLYELYDLKPFGSTLDDFRNSRMQYFHKGIDQTSFVTKNARSTPHIIHSIEMMHILSLSDFMIHGILLTPFTAKSNIIRFWSLKDNGVCLASLLSVPDSAVIAISNDLKYAALRFKKAEKYRLIEIYNLENGCLAYTLKSQISKSIFAHTTFCFNSRYLAMTSMSTSFENDRKALVVFEVWYLDQSLSICPVIEQMGFIPKITLFKRKLKIVRSFISEEITRDDRRVLKGYYIYVNEQGIATTKCLELKIDDDWDTEITTIKDVEYKREDQIGEVGVIGLIIRSEHRQNNTIQWLPEYNDSDTNDDLLHDSSSSCDRSSYNLDHQQDYVLQQSLQDHLGDDISDDPSDIFFSFDDESSLSGTSSFYSTLVDILDKYLVDGLHNFSAQYREIGCTIDNYQYLKCGFINTNQRKYLVRCGNHMLQLWQITESLTVDESKEFQNHRLVYIKPYVNSDYRSFYLSSNIWRIETFKSIKYIDSGLSPRVILNITEDENFLPEQRKKDVIVYTEEFLLPITDDDHVFDFHIFEGACQALYYLNIYFTEENLSQCQNDYWYNINFSKHRATILEKTRRLINSEIKKIDKNCASFRTTAGSKIVGMLASFEQGRDILKLLLKNEEVIFNLSSYEVDMEYAPGGINFSEKVRYSLTRFGKVKPFITKCPTGQIKYRKLSNEAMEKTCMNLMNENVLTILIRERQYQLYHLMLNRILYDSKNANPECLVILIDALLLLQELGNTDHYVKSCQKLSYLPIGNHTLLPTEVATTIPQEADLGIEGDLIVSIKDIYCFTAMEQIQKLRDMKFKQGLSYFGVGSVINGLLNAVYVIWVKLKMFLWSVVNFFNNHRTKSSDELVVCVVPLPYLNTYYRKNVRDAFLYGSNITSEKDKFKHSPYTKESAFVHAALNQHLEPNIWNQGDDAVAIILQYKWNAFIRKRFYAVYIIYLVYYISYCTGVQFALETYQYDSTSEERSITANSQHLTSISLFFLSGAILLCLEISQIPKSRKFIRYFRSWYNLVDLIAIFLPLINFLQLVQNWNYFYEIASICALIIWLHAIIRLRVFSSVGIALETIIQLFRKVISVLCILFIVVFGFTHAFIALLRQQPDQYFQENYGGEMHFSSNNEPQVVEEASLYDLSSSNGFTDPFKALYIVWLFIFGVWDPVTTGDSGDNRMIFALCMIFAFVTVLVFTNMLIALMSSTVEEVKKRGKRVWITHFAAVIAEMEDLTLKSTRHDRVNNPAFIFYMGNSERVSIHAGELRKDTQKLRKLLQIDDDTNDPIIYQNPPFV